MNKFLLLGLLLLQGCIIWFPVDIDYDIEIYLNEDRPDLRSEVGFISYDYPSKTVPNPDCWGFPLYKDSLRDNDLKVFLYSTELRKAEGLYNWIRDCASIVQYPTIDEAQSFSTVDIVAFTNSTRSSMDMMYGVYSDKNSPFSYEFKEMGGKCPGFKLYDSSNRRRYKTLVEVNHQIEHTLQAWLLRNRLPQIKELKEKRERIYAYRLIRHTVPPIIYNTFERTKSGVIYKLLDEEDRVVGSLTVHYPVYMDIIEGADCEYEVEICAMKKFIEMYCDKKCFGKYKGGVTAYVSDRHCEIVDLRRCDK